MVAKSSKNRELFSATFVADALETKRNLKMIKFKTILAASAAILMTATACNNTNSNSATEKAKQDSMDNARRKDSMDKAMATKKDSAGVMVGGAMMVASKDIVDNAVGSKDHTTLVAAVKQAGLVETLKGAGPFTVFAPTNDAFAKVDKKTLDGLMTDAQKPALTKILTYHVVAGALKSSDLKDGQVLTTVEGGKLTVMMKDGKAMIKDEMGNMANVTIADVIDKNGVTHVIDAVLMPKMDKMAKGKMDKKGKM
jgi:uncharacterized surface protein with fasciclin (FAS1) repeats